MTVATRQARHVRGLRAEMLAAIMLQLKGYSILARRFKTPVGEIDLIARRGKNLVFVEVKARSSATAAAEAIRTRNQQRIVRAAHYYLVAHPQFFQYRVRFDAVLVTAWHRWPKHIVQAFYA